MFLMKQIDLIHMLDPIQNEFGFFQNTLVDPEPEPGAGAETSIFRLQPKVSAPCGSGSTTLVTLLTLGTWHRQGKMFSPSVRRLLM
jgi:hypothetical protein